MNKLYLDIARRYLFGKKSTHSINIITGISIFGISLGTAALIMILSVFNGFEGLISGMFNAFNPDIKIEAREGKFFEIDSSKLAKLSALPGVNHLSGTIEEVALFEYKGSQEIGIIKGVDQQYASATGLDSFIVNGQFVVQEDNIQYAVLGAGMRNKLSLNIDDRLTPITVYMPLKKKQLFGTKEYTFRELYPAAVFSVQSDNDYQYILSSYEFASELIDKRGSYSALELEVDETKNAALIDSLNSLMGNSLTIKNRYQQDEAFMKVMEIEKWISFLITGFTMLLIAFNLVGALWMIVLDKRKDIAILKSMGYTRRHLRDVFLSLGNMISLLGIFFGIFLALFLYYLQKEFEIIGVPAGFLIDAYPVKLKFMDFFIVILTVLIIGNLASILPAIKASKSNMVLRSQ